MIQIKKSGFLSHFQLSFTENVYSNCNIEKINGKYRIYHKCNVHDYYISRTTYVSCFTLKYAFIHFLLR